MTLQEMFDKVAAHLRAMPKQSAIGMVCRYRMPPGGPLDRCAIGCLLPDEIYSEELEQKKINRLPPSVQSACSITSERHLLLALQLQDLHDRDGMWHPNDGIRYREQELARIADEFNLQYIPPNNQDSV